MKKVLLTLGIAPAALFAQEVTYDEFTMNPGYENMVFYSMDSGVVGEEIMASWDLAFDVRSMGSSVRINGGQGTVLYNAGDLDEWENIDDTFIDMTAKLSQLRNDNSAWSSGAFSQGGDDMFDLGWGIYDIVTHVITSDKVFVIALPDGSWKKIAILSLESGTYSFQYANLDGSEFVEDQLTKSDYPDKVLAFYSISNQVELDLEPSAEWDLVFLRYVEEIQSEVFYGVTGALVHPNTGVQMLEGLDDPYADGEMNLDILSYEANSVGYDWKTYAGGAYSLADDRCYFVQTNSGSQWRLVFTGFEGSTTGNIEIGKILNSGVSVADAETMDWSVYPNPAEGNSRISIQADFHIEDAMLTNMAGAVVFTDVLNGWNGFIQLNGLSPGMYILSLNTENGIVNHKMLIQ
jgi:hypothetical protein